MSISCRVETPVTDATYLLDLGGWSVLSHSLLEHEIWFIIFTCNQNEQAVDQGPYDLVSLNYKIKFNFKKIEEDCQSVAVKILTLYNMLPDFFFFLPRKGQSIYYICEE